VARNKLIVADTSLGVALVSGTIATLLFLRKGAADTAGPASAALGVTPLARGAFASWVGHF